MLKYKDLLRISKGFTTDFCNAINNNNSYREAAKGWGIGFEGSILWLMEASGEIQDDIKIFMDLKDGKCLEIKLLSPIESPPKSPIVTLKAPINIWKEMRIKRIDPTQFLMSGKLKIQGNVGIVMRYSKAATELGKLAVRQAFLKQIFGEYNLT